jgi:hypothetical protein
MSKSKPTVQDKELSTSMPVDNYDFNDMTTIDSALKAELDSKNLEYRWVNAKKLQENYGFDPRQWTPYRSETVSKNAFSQRDSEGYVRRGDLILAVQSKEIAAKRRNVVKMKNDRNKQHLRQSANELKDTFRRAGVKANISEGYDENE